MFIKRIFDVAISILGLIILLPMLIIIALIIKIKLGKPIFFIQERVGKRNKIFKMIKFRTMKDIKDENGKVLPDEKRHTTIGKTLRALSLDEIPELINVIKGDMSLVGPRPLLKEYLSLYSQEQLKRHQVLPGITGWAQINGRNAISWTEKFKLDIWYVCNWSLLLDLKILFLTIYKVIKKDGINQDDNITMEYFNGSN
ncbi:MULTISPECIES: sugar transferase [unclassified Clostridium]|uniref:sugar transferase n=1 Tax=unclassified Clostridium TaxID=2614128 RepID=UPI000E956673|nr:sugar transferase [Clostridium sp.]